MMIEGIKKLILDVMGFGERPTLIFLPIDRNKVA